LQLHNTDVFYNGRAVLREVSLEIKAGERIALVGESGAGKSTLLKLLFEQHKAGAALVPQDLGLVRNLSVFHNIYMGRLDRHSTWYNLVNLVRPLAMEVAQVRAVLAKLGLEDKLFAPAGELSGGQQQRTAVGRALFQQSDVILGDEPVSAVDEHQARIVLQSITEGDGTVVLAMHDVALALAFTDRVLGLKDGRVVLDEPVTSLKPADLTFLYKA
jgi:phosphonate transport system ATP-binding protein